MVRIVLEQPATAQFLVRKLYHFFINERAVPPDALLEPLCRVVSAKGVTTSRSWCGRSWPRAISTRRTPSGSVSKRPVEYVLGAVRAVYRSYGEDEADFRPLPHRAAGPSPGRDGAGSLRSPERQGLAGGTVLAERLHPAGRSNFAGALATGTLSSTQPRDRAMRRRNGPGPPPRPCRPSLALDPARLLVEEGVNRPTRSSPPSSSSISPAVSARRLRSSCWRSSPRGIPPAPPSRRVRGHPRDHDNSRISTRP